METDIGVFHGRQRMTEELRLWSVGQSGDAEPLSALQQMPTEMAFEELLVRNPQMLDPDIKLVGRQTLTQSGWLDLLAVDQLGRLVVFELKRGTLARDAVTQVVDYASAIDAMSVSQLAEHISERSGTNGIEGIDDFEQWYVDTFGADDLSRLLPPRMVLVGLGVDPAAERMARFMSGGPVDLSVVTFHGFTHGEERILARQLEVEPGPEEHPYRRSATTKERRSALREYLTTSGHEALFDRVHADIRQLIPERVYEQPGKTGIRLMLTEPDDSRAWKTYFGVQVGYMGSVCSVSILPQAIHWGDGALQRLDTAIKLHEWPHGGFFCGFQSEQDWSEHKAAVLEFVTSVMANRSKAVELQ